MKTKFLFLKLTAITLFFAMSVFVTSCKKDSTKNPTGDSHITFKLDGVAQNFTVVKGSNDGNSYIQVKGSKAADTTMNELEFYFFTDGPIMDGNTYHFGDVVYNVKYRDEAGLLYSITDGGITFNDESISHVKGTFSATVKNGSTTKVITDGNFDVSF